MLDKMPMKTQISLS